MVNSRQSDALMQLISSNELLIDAEDAAPILGSDPQTIRAAAQEGTIGFPTICYGSRVMIPRVPFLRFLGLTAEITLHQHGGATDTGH